MGVSGEDLLLSPGARSHFPFAPECKNQEKVGFWPTVRQAVANAGKHIPLIVFAKNHTQSWIAIPADAWFAMLHLAASGVGPHDTFKEYLDDAKNQIQER